MKAQPLETGGFLTRRQAAGWASVSPSQGLERGPREGWWGGGGGGGGEGVGGGGGEGEGAQGRLLSSPSRSRTRRQKKRRKRREEGENTEAHCDGKTMMKLNLDFLCRPKKV